MPMELAIDLAALALYDIVIYADDSGSMAFEEGGDRVNDLKLIVGRTAEVRLDSSCACNRCRPHWCPQLHAPTAICSPAVRVDLRL